MPNIPQPQRQDEPAVTEADLAALLAGTADAIPGLLPVADILAALTAEPTGAELAGEAHALAEFRRQAGAPVPATTARRGTAGLTSRFGVKVGASITAVAIVLGGGVAAAFADVLPAPIQRLAHEAIGAPVPPPGLPHRARPGVPMRAAHGQPAARGGPGAKRQPRPHATPTHAAQGSQGNSQGKGSQSQQGKGNSQGQGNKHGNGQGNGQAKQGAARHGTGQQVNSPKKGPHGSPQMNRRPAGHPRRSVRPGQS